MMSSTSPTTSFVPTALATLSAATQARGWTDTDWARAAGIPKETLCRIRARGSCDLQTLEKLARAVGSRLTVAVDSGATCDGLWPRRVDREFEERLVARVAAGGPIHADQWRSLGPPFFLAGVAVTLASVSESDRPAWLALAEELHPGSTEPRVFQRWLDETPLPPARFLPLVGRAEVVHAA